GIGEIGHFQFVVGDRRDHRRRALVAHWLKDVGLAQMLRQILLFQNNGRPVRDRRHPRHTDLYRFGTVGRADPKQAEHARNGQCEFLQAHGFPPSFAGLAYFMASFSSRTAKIVGGPTDFGKSGLVGRNTTNRYMESGNEFARRVQNAESRAAGLSAPWEAPPRRPRISGGAAGNGNAM